MELIEIFTKKNIEILKLLSKESLHIRDIAGNLDISPAKVHNTIQLFKKNNLIRKTRKKIR
ncbi:hypothetical protein CMO93_00555 [Candidatus Woesearchaeota archaeon]|nr:hypothetical protein [Candidatus Woesearchaeota archaeon]